MKKIALLFFALLLSFSVPMLAAADEMGHDMGPGAHHFEKGACCDGHDGACMKGGKMGAGMRGMRERMGEMGWAEKFRLPRFYLMHSGELKLTDDQVASMKKISLELKKDAVTKGADVKVRRLELAEVLAKPDYKLEDATAKMKEIEDARLALETAVLQHAVEARNVLTPDQQKAVKDIRGKGRCGKGPGKEKMKRHMPAKG